MHHSTPLAGCLEAARDRYGVRLRAAGFTLEQLTDTVYELRHAGHRAAWDATHCPDVGATVATFLTGLELGLALGTARARGVPEHRPRPAPDPRVVNRLTDSCDAIEDLVETIRRTLKEVIP